MADLLVRLYDLPAVAPRVEALKTRGIVIRRAMPYEKHQVVDWVRLTFSPGWASETDVAFTNHPVSCFIATEEGTIVGFACYESTCRDYFGPTGVAETKRGQGVGTALLLACLHAMSGGGYAYAVIGGAGPKDFYAKTVGAVEIPGSSPGIYRDFLRPPEPEKKKRK